MGVNSFNVGRDGAQLTIFDSIQGQVDFNGQIGFDTKARTKELESETINGDTIFRNVPNGHEGTFEFDRQDASVSSYFANKEAAFFAQLPPSQAVITQTISELSGTVSQFQYIGVELKLDDDGSWKGLDKVVQRVSWKASKKIQVA
jgi:hypothetical protein